MPNITISGLPFATLPLDGPNSFFEVQTIEAGVTVSRKVAADDINITSAIVVEDESVPLAGGADTLDFVGAGVTASGAGSTKTITIPGGGQVDSVVGGTNISVNAGDPVNPIVNLDAAITGVSVNGVTLSNAGVATDFLNEQGNYVAAGGGSGVISFVINADINTATPPTTEPVNCRVDYEDLSGTDSLGFVGFDGSNALQVQNRMQGGESTIRGEDTGGIQRLALRANYNLTTGETYISGAETVAMRFMTGNEYAVLATLNLGVDLRHNNIDMARTVAIGSGGFEVNNTVTGAGFERVLTTSDLGGGGSAAGSPTEIQYNTAGAFDASAGFIWDEANRRLVLDRAGGAGAGIKMNNLLSNTPALEIGGPGSISTNHVVWRSYDQSGSFYWQMFDDHGLSSANHKLEIQGSTTGSTPFIEWNLSGEMSLFGAQNSEAILFTALTGTKKMKAQIPLYMENRASANADDVNEGQFWVRNTGNNEPMFTDGVGVDFVLNAAASLTPWTSDIDGAGFTLEDAGYLFLRGQSAADPDVTGQGQIWVEEGAAGDPLWAEVEMLADMEGPDAATSYTEISVNSAVATFFGNAELDTAQFNSGTSSLLLDGTNSYITFPDIAAYDLGTQSWTIEGFVRFNTLPPLQTSLGPGYVLYDSRKGGSALVQYGIIQDGFGYRVRLVGQDWGAEVGTISGGLLINTWYHWAVTRDVGGDGNVRAYFNGLYEVADFGVSPADLGNPDAPIYIGSRTGVDAYMDGWIDDVRVTIGTARYAGTGAYSIPTTPYLGAAGSQGLFFVDDAGLSTDLLTGAASSLQATMAIGATTSIDLSLITGAALIITDAADVDTVTVEINTTTMAPAEALAFIATANVEVYSFDEGINIDGGDIHVGGSTNGLAFWRYGDAVSSSLRNSTAGITLQVVGAGDIFRIQSDSIELSEASAPVAASAGYGQIWVRDDVPNNLAFTDDADEDFAVAYATGRETANATHDFNTAGNIAENFIGFYDDGAAYTVTLEDSTSVVNWPLHTAIQVLAPTVGAITVAEGSGTTLFLDDGTDTVGGGTLTQGVVTIYRTSTTDYYIWGSGFTP